MERFKDLHLIMEGLRDGAAFRTVGNGNGVSWGFFDAEEVINIVEAAMIDGADPEQFLWDMMDKEGCNNLEELVVSNSQIPALTETEVKDLLAELGARTSKIGTAYPRSLVRRLNRRSMG